jgi:hypothetical protein
MTGRQSSCPYWYTKAFRTTAGGNVMVVTVELGAKMLRLYLAER